MNKSDLLKNGLSIIISMGELYILFGKKYINLSSFLLLSFSYSLGRHLVISLQKDNSGGTTPYNPLKIPAKNISPANH